VKGELDRQAGGRGRAVNYIRKVIRHFIYTNYLIIFNVTKRKIITHDVVFSIGFGNIPLRIRNAVVHDNLEENPSQPPFKKGGVFGALFIIALCNNVFLKGQSDLIST